MIVDFHMLRGHIQNYNTFNSRTVSTISTIMKNVCRTTANYFIWCLSAFIERNCSIGEKSCRFFVRFAKLLISGLNQMYLIIGGGNNQFDYLTKKRVGNFSILRKLVTKCFQQAFNLVGFELLQFMMVFEIEMLNSSLHTCNCRFSF